MHQEVRIKNNQINNQTHTSKLLSFLIHTTQLHIITLVTYIYSTSPLYLQQSWSSESIKKYHLNLPLLAAELSCCM